MSTGGLYNADGTFVPFSAADLSTELATRQNAGVFFGELDGWLNALPDPEAKALTEGARQRAFYVTGLRPWAFFPPCGRACRSAPFSFPAS